MAEAMLARKPVIATGYSGNLDFMTNENSFLVRHDMATVPSGCDPYPPGAAWAEPDIDHASHLMRLVYEDSAQRQRVARRAHLEHRDIAFARGAGAVVGGALGRDPRSVRRSLAPR